MSIGDKKHLLNFMKLLESNDTHFSCAWCLLQNEAELTLVTLANDQHVSGH